MLDDRKDRNKPVYNLIVQEMEKIGYSRTWTQIQTKWQNIKRAHNAQKPLNNKSGNSRVDTDPTLAEILDTRPSSLFLDCGIDTAAHNSGVGEFIEGRHCVFCFLHNHAKIVVVPASDFLGQLWVIL